MHRCAPPPVASVGCHGARAGPGCAVSWASEILETLGTDDDASVCAVFGGGTIVAALAYSGNGRPSSVVPLQYVLHARHDRVGHGVRVATQPRRNVELPGRSRRWVLV